MMSQHPLITVLVCNYNYGKHIGTTLDSVRSQTYPNIEVIIVDDGSSDDSVQRIKRYSDSHPELKITLKAKKKNQGLCYARNDALDLVTSEYFLFLDSDDTIPQEYVSSMLKALEINKADVVYGDVKAFGGENYVTDYPSFDIQELLKRNYINISSLVKTSSLQGQRFDVNLNRKTHEDYDFWLGLSLKGLKFVKAKKTYLNYRIQHVSRNANVLNMKERAVEISGIWKYSYLKYQKQFPKKLTQEMIFDFYDYQLSKVGDELMALNDIVQTELVPELRRREVHIEYITNKPLRQIIKERLKEFPKKS